VIDLTENEIDLGKDLKLKFDEIGADLSATKKGDLGTVTDADNLAQAIIARLSTDEGELYDIGHADYGSRLHDVIGEINNEATRQRIKGLVRECLVQEHRIREVINVNVIPHSHDPNRVDIEMTILPIKSSGQLKIVYPFSLEG
jgi:phage baseplate assembly protein W